MILVGGQRDMKDGQAYPARDERARQGELLLWAGCSLAQLPGILYKKNSS
jgi:hypothetical protein